MLWSKKKRLMFRLKKFLDNRNYTVKHMILYGVYHSEAFFRMVKLKEKINSFFKI